MKLPHRPAQAATWNAADYAANSAVQQSWARELIARLHLRGDEQVLDVGCGDGKVTAELARAVPRGHVLGVDASPEMIAFARKAFPASKISNLNFQIGDAREIGQVVRPGSNSKKLALNARSEVGMNTPPPPHKPEDKLELNGSSPSPRPSPPGEGETLPASWQSQTSGGSRVQGVNYAGNSFAQGEGERGGMFDLVFSNAALHWVDDHEAILRGAAAVLKPGGRLVVSCGGKGNAHAVFLALRPEMRLQRWRGFFRKMPAPYFFHAPADYEKWLPKFGFKTNLLKLAPKDATYAGADGFATWLRTTWLPYLQRVPENLREEFIAAVTRRYLAKHPADAEGKVHVRMVRLEIDAVRVG